MSIATHLDDASGDPTPAERAEAQLWAAHMFAMGMLREALARPEPDMDWNERFGSMDELDGPLEHDDGQEDIAFEESA